LRIRITFNCSGSDGTILTGPVLAFRQR